MVVIILGVVLGVIVGALMLVPVLAYFKRCGLFYRLI